MNFIYFIEHNAAHLQGRSDSVFVPQLDTGFDFGLVLRDFQLNGWNVEALGVSSLGRPARFSNDSPQPSQDRHLMLDRHDQDEKRGEGYYPLYVLANLLFYDSFFHVNPKKKYGHRMKVAYGYL